LLKRELFVTSEREKSGLFQEPLPRALFDLRRGWVGSNLNNKAAPCTKSWFSRRFAAATDDDGDDEPGKAESQKL